MSTEESFVHVVLVGKQCLGDEDFHSLRVPAEQPKVFPFQPVSKFTPMEREGSNNPTLVEWTFGIERLLKHQSAPPY